MLIVIAFFFWVIRNVCWFWAACGDNKTGRRDNVPLSKGGTKAAAVLMFSSEIMSYLWPIR